MLINISLCFTGLPV